MAIRRKKTTISDSNSPPEYIPRERKEVPVDEYVAPLPAPEPAAKIVDFREMARKIGDLESMIEGDMEILDKRIAGHAIRSGKAIETTIDRASRQEFWGCRVKFRANVVAKAISPYLVPYEIEIECPRWGDKRCFGCKVIGAPEVKIDLMDERAISLVDSSSRAGSRQLISELAEIPAGCRSWNFDVKKKANIQDLFVSGAFSSIISNEEVDAIRRVLYTGHDIAANSLYMMHGKVASNPKTNEVIYLVDEIVPEQDDILDIKVTDEMIKSAEFFQPADPKNPRSIKHRLDEIYEDLADNVTNIYGRRNLHMLIDLGFHSALAWQWEGDPADKLYKGATEIIILGDSGQGKSETMMRLRDHYGRGERIDCKSASYAGLVGGIDDFGGRRFMVWGRIPQNDKGCVILDEVKGMPIELVAQLTDVRSSQMAIVTRIGGTRRASARVRYFWLSNPRGRMRVSEFGHGVTAILDLLGSPEDVRRIDLAIIVSSGEVPQEFIDQKIISGKAVEHLHSKEHCSNLLKLVWSRVGTKISNEVKKHIVKKASGLARKYSSRIPLLEPADARYKIARLSIALAGRVGSFTEDYSGMLVKECHVDVVCDFIQEIYDNPNFAFDLWSEGQKRETDSTEIEQSKIIEMIKALPAPQVFVEALSGAEWISWIIVKSAVGGDKDKAEKIIEELVSAHYLTKYRKSYRKTPKMIQLLRTIFIDEPEDEPEIDLTF